MISIWKFPVSISGTITVSMPVGAKVLTVQDQNGRACLWALVDPRASVEIRRFRIFGTGHSIDGDGPGEYVGTFQQMGGNLVWHVFEATGAPTPDA